MAKSKSPVKSPVRKPAAAPSPAKPAARGAVAAKAPATVTKNGQSAKGIAAAAVKGAAAAASVSKSVKATAKVTPPAAAASKVAPKPAVAGKAPASKVAAPAVSKGAAVVAKPGVIIARPGAVIATPAVRTNGHLASAAGKAKPTVEVKPAKSDRPRNGSSHAAPLMPPRPIPEAVPTDGKPRKNQAGLTSKELEHFRSVILEKRRELVGDMVSMESEALRTSGGTNLSNMPAHMADLGTDNYEQEFTLGLVEKDRGLLRELNSALAKIQNGTYGICEGTGKPIAKVRLEAQPWARFSIEHARSLERRIR